MIKVKILDCYSRKIRTISSVPIGMELISLDNISLLQERSNSRVRVSPSGMVVLVLVLSRFMCVITSCHDISLHNVKPKYVANDALMLIDLNKHKKKTKKKRSQ